jgi:hypothetical protein
LKKLLRCENALNVSRSKDHRAEQVVRGFLGVVTHNAANVALRVFKKSSKSDAERTFADDS